MLKTYPEDECVLAEDFEDGNDQTSYIALMTGDMLQPVYILKIFEKSKACTKMHDKYVHVILLDEL